MPRVKANDTELYYEEAGAGGETLVLVHGWISSHRNWMETIPRLPLERYRVLAFDLRGAGRSGRPTSGHRIEQYADDLAAAMTALGVEMFHFTGHSMGGLVGLLLALRHPRRLRKLVLVAPAASGGLPYPDMLIPVMAARHDAARYRAMVELVTADRPLPQRLLDVIVEDAAGCSEGHAEESWRSMRDLDISDRLGEISAPTLMVVGDRDGLRPFNLDDTKRIPNCALQVFYRAGHWIPWDVPQAFADLLVDFLEWGTAPAVDPQERGAQLQSIQAPATAS
jgi:pimeloyl-ACP methyl ester carboxylesterase